MIQYFKEELYHLCLAARKEPSRKLFFKLTFSDSFIISTLFKLRQLCRYFYVPVLSKFFRLIQMAFYGVELGAEIKLGKGVFFVHSLGIVIGGTAQIGNRVRFMGNNTVGTAKDNGYPILEDDVEVGCGARILGPVRIGKGAKIGANAVVLQDIPAGAIAVGIPAKTIKIVPIEKEPSSVRPLSNDSHDNKKIQELWINITKEPWKTLTLVSTHQPSKLVELANQITLFSKKWADADGEISVYNATHFNAENILKIKEDIHLLHQSKAKTLILCPSPVEEPWVEEIVNITDRCALCVETEKTSLSEIHQINSRLGKNSLMGCIYIN